MKARTITVMAMSGLFLLLDQGLKYMALNAWASPRVWLHSYMGWEPFINTGVAFSIPIPSALTVLFTLPIMGAMIYSLTRELEGTASAQRHHARIILALSLIVSGGLSNLIDRIRFGSVVDYFRIFTAVINVGDILIVSGFLVYLLALRQESKRLEKQEQKNLS